MIRDLKIDLLTTKDIDLKGRRVIGASNAANKQDYVTLSDLQTKLAPSAYSDTTNADNIIAGKISKDRLPNWLHEFKAMDRPSRAYGVSYQNTKPYPIFISTTHIMPAGAASTTIITVYVDTVNPPANSIASASSYNPTLPATSQLCFIVLPGLYYKIDYTSFAAPLVTAWMEWN